MKTFFCSDIGEEVIEGTIEVNREGRGGTIIIVLHHTTNSADNIVFNNFPTLDL